MVMCGPSILKHSDVIGRVQKALGDKFVGMFSGVQPHVPLETVAPAADSAELDLSRWNALGPLA